jgi:hypothetical protein
MGRDLGQIRKAAEAERDHERRSIFGDGENGRMSCSNRLVKEAMEE